MLPELITRNVSKQYYVLIQEGKGRSTEGETYRKFLEEHGEQEILAEAEILLSLYEEPTQYDKKVIREYFDDSLKDMPPEIFEKLLLYHYRIEDTSENAPIIAETLAQIKRFESAYRRLMKGTP